MKKKKIKYRNIILLFLFLFCFLFITKISMMILSVMKENNETNKMLMDLALMDVKKERKIDNVSTYINPPYSLEDPYYKYIHKPFLEVDFGKLLSKNKDTKGYIEIENTSFSYPFVQTSSSFYKTHNYNKKENKTGFLYLAPKGNARTFDQFVLYMDGEESKRIFKASVLLKKKWLTSKSLIKVSDSYQNTLWKPFSIYIADHGIQNFSSFSFLKERSIYDFKVEGYSEEKIITLIFRYDKNHVVIMHAKLIKKMIR